VRVITRELRPSGVTNTIRTINKQETTIIRWFFVFWLEIISELPQKWFESYKFLPYCTMATFIFHTTSTWTRVISSRLIKRFFTRLIFFIHVQHHIRGGTLMTQFSCHKLHGFIDVCEKAFVTVA